MTDEAQSLPTPDEGTEDDFLTFLLAHDVALAADLGSPGMAPLTPGAVDEEDRARLEQARACLELLHRRWPWPEAGGGSKPMDTPGVTLGRFEIRHLLGRGGHGLVFLAFDPVLRRSVALKVPRPEALASPKIRARFLREARAVARLSHPGIIPVHDFGEVGPVCYLASAFVDGPNLGRWLADRMSPLEPAMVARIGIELAEAVAHAHDRGVLHRDLKPANVLLEGAGKGAELAFQPRITDFGLAKLLDDVGEETQIGPMGTPRYMAPEQARGDRTRIGPRADLYGLGAILHHMLSDLPPEGPLRGRARALAGITGIPEDLRSIVTCCLQDKPDDRYMSARALADDLRRYLAGKPVRAARRDRRGWAGTGIGLTTVAIVLAFASWLIPNRAATSRLTPSGRLVSVAPNRVGSRASYLRNIHQASQRLADLNVAGADAILALWSRKAGPDDPRSFEWGYLKRKAHRESITMVHDRGDVYHVRYAPDGRWIVSAGQDQTVRLWDSNTGASRIHPLRGHQGDVNSVEVSPDGQSLVSAGDDGTVRLWSVKTGAPLARPLREAPDLAAPAAIFSADGRRVIAGYADGSVRIWDPTTGRQLDRTNLTIGMIKSLATPPDGAFIAAGGDSGHRLSLLDPRLHKAQDLLRPEGPLGVVYSMAFSPDGRRLAATVGPPGVCLWQTSGELESILRVQSEPACSVAFSPDGVRLATGGDHLDPSIRIWDVSTGNLLDVLTGHANRVWSVAFSPDGTRLASASRDGTVKLWDLERRRDQTTIPLGTGPLPVEFRFVDGDAALQVLFKDGRRSAFDTDGRLLKSQPTSTLDRTIGTRLAPDGRVLTYLSPPNLLRLADPGAQDVPLAIANGPSPQDFPLTTFSPDGQLMAYFDRAGGLVKVVDTNTGALVRDGSFDGTAPSHLILQSGGGLIVVSGEYAYCSPAPESAGQPTAGLIAQGGPVSFAVSPDGLTFATGCRDGTIRLFDTRSFAVRALLTGHTNAVTHLAFAPDGHTLASADRSGVVRLWDPVEVQDVLTLDSPSKPLGSLDFSPDGRTLGAYVPSNRAIILWHGGRE